MSTIQDSDQFLVQRDSDSFKQSAINLMSTIQDTDYMLVQRGEDSFKVSCLDVKDQLGGGGASPPALQSVTLVQNAPIDGNRFTGKSFTSTAVNTGQFATSLDMTAAVTGALGIKAGSAVIETNNYLGGSSVVLDLQSDLNLGTVVEVGDTVDASASYTPQTSTITDIAFNAGTANPVYYSFDTPPNVAIDETATYDYTTTASQAYIATGSFFFVVHDLINSTADVLITSSIGGFAAYKSDDGANWTALSSISAPADLSVRSLIGTARYFLWGGLDSQWANCSFKFTQSWVDAYANNIQLTFEDNTDLRYFSQGDKVQGQWNQSQVWTDLISGDYFSSDRPPVNGFDGNETTSTYANYLTNGDGTFSASGFEPGATVEIKTIYANGSGGGNAVTDGTYIEINGVRHIAPAGSGDQIRTGTIDASGNLTVVYTTDTGGGSVGWNYVGFYYIKVAGTFLVNPEFADTSAAHVISVDPANSQMTVDGGSWNNANESQVWSAAAADNISNYFSGNYAPGSFDYSTDLKVVFDGSEDTAIATTNGATPATLTLNLATPLAVQNKVEILGYNDQTVSCTTTAGTFTAASATGDTKEYGVITGVTGNLLSVSSVGGGASTLGLIKVDGRVLVDAVRDSQVWSDLAVDGSSPQVQYPLTLAFNGDTTSSYNCCFPEPGGYVKINFTGLSDVNKVTIYYTKAGSGTSLEVNGVGQTLSDAAPAAATIDVDVTGTGLVSLQWTEVDSSNFVGIFGVRLDGAMMLDSGVRSLGETSAHTLAPKQGSGTVSDITGTQVTIEPFTDNCFVEGQFLTVDKTVDVSPVTDPIAGYDDATKTLTFTDSKDLVQFVNGDGVYMADADGTAVVPTFTTSGITNVAKAAYAVGGTITGAIHPSSGKTLGTIFNGIVSKTFGVDNGVCTGNAVNNVLTFGSPIVLAEDDELKVAMFKNGDGGQIVDMRFDDGSTLRFEAPDLPSTSVSGTVEENLTTIDHQGRNLVGMNYYGSGSNVTTVNGFYINGTLLIDGKTTALTFADSTNFDKFQVGDVVEDTRNFNDDRDWAASTTTTALAGFQNLANLYDGDISTLCHANPDGSDVVFTVTFDPPLPCKSGVTVYGVIGGIGSASADYWVNGGSKIPFAVNAGGDSQDPNFYAIASGEVSEIKIQRTGNPSDSAGLYLHAIQIDQQLLVAPGTAGITGEKVEIIDIEDSDPYTILVDGGEWRVAGAPNYSDLGTGTPYGPDYGWTQVFDGTVSTAANGQAFAAEGATMTWTPESPIPVTNQVTFYVLNSSNQSTYGLRVNGSSWLENTAQYGQAISISDASLGGNLTKIELINGGLSGPYLTGVEVDGVLLADSTGETSVSVTKGGNGTVDSVNVGAKSMTLSASNDQWVDGYRVATPTKPAVATTAYLEFNQTGAVSGYSPVPVPVRAMDNPLTPTLTFPAEFSDTGTAPDAEFADSNAYLEVSVTLKNQNGESGPKSSNPVVPSTNLRSISPGEVTNNAEGVGRMIEQVVTHEQRVADNYASEMKKRHDRLQAALDLQKKGMTSNGKA